MLSFALSLFLWMKMMAGLIYDSFLLFSPSFCVFFFCVYDLFCSPPPPLLAGLFVLPFIRPETFKKPSPPPTGSWQSWQKTWSQFGSDALGCSC
ncbi:hypothetical protein NC651_039217 [Populus alba x Populus x berolinensis]|nr:hypothetical protein NC651_039217 [Populus alba x Populus x berolinensis]